MSRSRYVTPSRTAERIERVRLLITTLQAGPMTRDDVGVLLSIGPSGVRKYMTDLEGIVESFGEFGHLKCRLVSDKAKVAHFLATQSERAASRPAKPRKCALTIAAQDPARHFHIMQDDVEFKLTPVRKIPAHTALMACFFNMLPAQVWA